MCLVGLERCCTRHDKAGSQGARPTPSLLLSLSVNSLLLAKGPLPFFSRLHKSPDPPAQPECGTAEPPGSGEKGVSLRRGLAMLKYTLLWCRVNAATHVSEATGQRPSLWEEQPCGASCPLLFSFSPWGLPRVLLLGSWPSLLGQMTFWKRTA